MTEKQQLYLALTDRLCGLSDVDVWLMEHQFVTWEQARKIDDWLFLYRDDPRVGAAQYARNCERLLNLYERGKNS